MASRMKTDIQRMHVDHTALFAAPAKVVGIILTALTVASG
jgi:hypothetical protein